MTGFFHACPDAECHCFDDLKAEWQDRRAIRDHFQSEASKAMRKAARHLIDEGLSYRDAAYLLGVSYQRIAQLIRP